MNNIETFLTLVRQADFEAIEDARAQILFSDLGPLITAYETLEIWDQKAALIHLIQDHHDPRFRPILLDFLKAPDSQADDHIILTKAIAICILDGNDDDFIRYYNDTRLIQPRANQILSASALEPLHRQEAPLEPIFPKLRTALQIFALTAILVGSALLAFSAINIYTLEQYRQRGVTVQARLTSKSQENNTLCVAVSYFDKDLSAGGELYLTDICEFIPAEIWDSLQIDSQVQVVYLPKDPLNNTILAASLDDKGVPPINRLPIGSILLGLGFAALFGYFILTRID